MNHKASRCSKKSQTRRRLNPQLVIKKQRHQIWTSMTIQSSSLFKFSCRKIKKKILGHADILSITFVKMKKCAAQKAQQCYLIRRNLLQLPNFLMIHAFYIFVLRFSWRLFLLWLNFTLCFCLISISFLLGFFPFLFFFFFLQALFFLCLLNFFFTLYTDVFRLQNDATY